MLGRIARNVGVLPSPHWASETSQNIEMFAYSKFSWAARRRHLAETHHPMITLSKFLFFFSDNLFRVHTGKYE